MITNTRYLVVHQDSPKEFQQFYGPFVSQRLAEEFRDNLPIKNGSKTFIAPLHSSKEFRH